MSREPFRPEQIEEKATEVYIEQLLDLAEKIKTVREVVRKDAESLDRRMQTAGYVRGQWKQTEEALPALMAEAHESGWSVERIAAMLDVTESYVYRRLREQSATE
ncbi:helix-turn-helix domain-containing protein [Streptomyces sp. NPDC048436]|uniref:helix-turn-helix domain-containing protein n=1 Tax=Streptomyces sp. NPDC048436 TaxID=3365550 RepID=UPI003723ABDE